MSPRVFSPTFAHCGVAGASTVRHPLGTVSHIGLDQTGASPAFLRVAARGTQPDLTPVLRGRRRTCPRVTGVVSCGAPIEPRRTLYAGTVPAVEARQRREGEMCWVSWPVTASSVATSRSLRLLS